MNAAILAEGKSDAILISYFLTKIYGWRFDRRLATIALPVDQANETLYWYYRDSADGQDQLAIFGVGGITNIAPKFHQAMDRNRVELDPGKRFSKLVILIDRDNRDDAGCKTLIAKMFATDRLLLHAEVITEQQIVLNDWFTASIQVATTPASIYPTEFLCIVLPQTGVGALENFLLNEFATAGGVDAQLVREADRFVKTIPDDPYLRTRRLRPKAQLGTVLSVISPDWVFSKLDNRINQVDWARLPGVLVAYQKLGGL